MTWSIVARDARTGEFGIAVASRFFAVGAMVPHIRAGVGAVATQAFVNPLYGTTGLKLLDAGLAPDAVVRALTEPDAGAHARQLHLIDAQGRNAAYTGPDCVEWAGHRVADGVSIAGNMLVGPAVLDDTLATFQSGGDLPMADRLLAAMDAGDAAGGDKRGRQSAALLVWRDQDYPWLDIRADDHATPLTELRRLYQVAQERFLLVLETMPTRTNPSGLTDRSEIDRRIEALEAERRAAGYKTASYGDF